MDKSLIISFISVVISFLTFFFSIVLPLLRKCKLTVSLFKQIPISLIFNHAGTSLKLRFSIHSKNKESTIKEIEIILKRTSDNKTLKLEWSLLENPFTMWATHLSNTFNYVHFARPVKINTNSVEPFVIEFLNYKDSDEVLKIYTKLKQIIYDKIDFKNIKNIDEFIPISNELKKLKEIDDLLNQLFAYDFWQTDNYILNLNILYNDKKWIENKFSFTINKDILTTITKHTFINNTLLDITRNLYNDPSIKYRIENNMKSKFINIPIYNIKKIK